MTKKIAIAFFTGAALSLASGAIAGEAPPLLPDAARGNVGGKAGIIGWPVDGEEFLSPFGFDLVLVPEQDQDRELRFPAGEWIAPPRGRYKLWLEGAGQMSPGFIVLNHSAAPFTGQGRVLALPLVPAGRVELHSSFRAGGATLRLMHLDRVHDGRVQREVTRRVVGDARYSGAWMPQGRVVAALYDSHRQGYVGLSRPVRVTAGQEIAVAPGPPAHGRSHLIARLERPAGVVDPAAAGIELRLRGDGRDDPPDITVPLFDRVYALWYDLAPGEATLEGGGAHSFLAPTEILLEGGRIASVQAALEPRPSLDVSVFLPDSLVGAGRLRLIDEETRARVGEATVNRGQVLYSFSSLPARELLVALEAPPWVFWERADLTAGDASVVISPVPIHLHGGLYWGDEPWPGTIELATDPRRGLSMVIHTDEEGAYETTLFRGGHFMATIRLEGLDQPYLEGLDAIHASGRLDFRLPRNHFVVEVVDESTGEPVAAADVTLVNIGEDRKQSGQKGETDEEGRLRLPPLRKGSVSIYVTKDAYRQESLEDVPVLGDSDEETVLRVELRPEGRGWPLQIFSPIATPLQGAEVAVANRATANILWSDFSDSVGRVEVPSDLGGDVLLLKHRDTGFDVRPVPWHPDPDDPTVWSAPAKASPLIVRAVGNDGDPSPWSGMVLWIDDIALQGVLLGWLTHGTAGCDDAGFWRVSNLPVGRSLAVEAIRNGSTVQPISPYYGVAISPDSVSPLLVTARR